MNINNESSEALDFENDRLKKFRKLVKYANANSPYYAKIIRENGISIASSVPEDFPVLTKSIAMENFDDIVTDRNIRKKEVLDFIKKSSDPRDLYLNKYRAVITSGSFGPGKEGYFVSSLKDSLRGIKSILPSKVSRKVSVLWKVFLWFFKKRKRIHYAFYGNVGGHNAGYDMSTKFPALFFNVKGFEINNSIAKTSKELTEFQPEVLAGFTTVLKDLGEEQFKGNLKIHPLFIIASGETVTKQDIEFLSERFPGSHVMSVYTCSEHGNMGRSNLDRETMTLYDDKLIFEFHENHTLVTNLCNYTMPLIRYQMNDVLTPVSEKNTHPTIVKNLVSRSEITVNFINKFGNSENFTSFITRRFYVDGVRKFQMQVTSNKSFIFLACYETHLNETEKKAVLFELEKKLKNLLKIKNLENLSYHIQVVEDIPVDRKTRKFNTIVFNTV